MKPIFAEAVIQRVVKQLLAANDAAGQPHAWSAAVVTALRTRDLSDSTCTVVIQRMAVQSMRWDVAARLLGDQHIALLNKSERLWSVLENCAPSEESKQVCKRILKASLRPSATMRSRQ